MAYEGETEIGYKPLGHKIVVEGITEVKKLIVSPNEEQFEEAQYEELRVVALGPRAKDQGIELGDAVMIDPRINDGVRINLPWLEDRKFFILELHSITGVIPAEYTHWFKVEKDNGIYFWSIGILILLSLISCKLLKK